MNIVRRGPGHFLVQSKNVEMTKDALESTFECLSVIKDPQDGQEDYLNALSICDSDDSIVAIVKDIPNGVTVQAEAIEYILFISETMTNMIFELYNRRDEMGIEKMRRSIDRVIMRVTGNHDAFIEAVKEDVNGEVIQLDQFYEQYFQGTFINFTEEGLDEPVEYTKLLNPVIRTDMERYDTLELLENNRLKYVNASIENKDWTALNIKIYDSFEQFELHYKRMVDVLAAMDAGLVLGESWGKDSAVMFLSVGVYSVRLFTYLDPSEIKKILLGLEYKDDGTRVVDYDLFLKKKKIHWNDVRVDSLYRDELGLHYRKELMDKLSEEDKQALLDIEKDIKEA